MRCLEEKCRCRHGHIYDFGESTNAKTRLKEVECVDCKTVIDVSMSFYRRAIGFDNEGKMFKGQEEMYKYYVMKWV